MHRENPSNPNLNPPTPPALRLGAIHKRTSVPKVAQPSHPRLHLGAIHKNKSAGELQTGISKGKGTVCPTCEHMPEYREGFKHINVMSLKSKSVADMRSGSCRVSQNLT